MFKHLKPEEFIDLIEGRELPVSRRAHCDACPPCTEVFQSMQATQAALTVLHEDPPEPDWAAFRSSVRDQLLSRSVQRSSAFRRWTGWPIRPAVAWALSLCAVVAATGGLFWQVPKSEPTLIDVTSHTIEVTDDDPEWAAWSTTAVFDEIHHLEVSEQDQLRILLESEQRDLKRQ
jgi:hypothetical protein